MNLKFNQRKEVTLIEDLIHKADLTAAELDYLEEILITLGK